MGEAQGLGPVAEHGRSVEERDRIALRRPGRARVDRLAVRGDAEEPVRLDAAGPLAMVAGEPCAERGADLGVVGGATGDRHDRPAQSNVEPVDVDDVEAADHDAIQQHGTDVLEVPRRLDEAGDAFRRVPAIDLDRIDPHGLDVGGGRNDDGGDGGTPVGPREAPVIDRDDPNVGLGESAT